MNTPKYKYLLTYRYSEIIHDLTVEFCRVFLVSHLSNLGRFSNQRTTAQMDHAARSGKQNIVEGVGQSVTSKKGEIKLLGVAKASLEELTIDYEDFLRQRGLKIWDRSDPRVMKLRQLGIAATLLKSPKLLKLPKSPEEAANLMLTLCHMCTFLLDRQIKSLENRFVKEGGYTENLFRKRLNHKSLK